MLSQSFEKDQLVCNFVTDPQSNSYLLGFYYVCVWDLGA